MSTDNLTQILTGTIDRLSRQESLKELFHQHRDGDPLPSGRALKEIIELARSILFPGFFGNSTINTRTLKYHIGVDIERMHKLLTDQILAGAMLHGQRMSASRLPSAIPQATGRRDSGKAH